MNTKSIKKSSVELENFIKKARRKLLEVEVMQAEWEKQNGKGKVFKTAKDLIKYVKSK